MYVFVLLRVCVCVRELVCVFRRVVLVLCLPVCVAETLHDPAALGPSHLKQEILFLTILKISRHLLNRAYIRADAITRETSSKTSTFFTKLVITFEVLNRLNWGARI